MKFTLKRNLWIRFCLTLIFVFNWAHADSKLENWVQINQTFGISPSLALFAEVQPRISYSEGELASILARLAPIYLFNSNHSVGVGFLWLENYSPSANNETRLFLQYIFQHGSLGRSNFFHRFRAEHRNINITEDKAYRLRYQIRSLHAWFKNKNLRALLQNELFINLNTTDVSGPVAGFDQNRLALGINYAWSTTVNSDIGYMYNFVRRPRALSDRNNHVFYYCLNANF